MADRWTRQRQRAAELKAGDVRPPGMERLVELRCFFCRRLLGRFPSRKAALEAVIRCPKCHQDNPPGALPRPAPGRPNFPA